MAFDRESMPPHMDRSLLDKVAAVDPRSPPTGLLQAGSCACNPFDRHAIEALPRSELLERGPDGGLVVGGRARLEVQRRHPQDGCLAVGLRVDPAGKPRSDEGRHHVIAPAPVRYRHVHLEPVVEAEQRLRDAPVVDQAVERREQRGPTLERPVEQLRFDPPASSEALDRGLDPGVPWILVGADTDEALAPQPPTVELATCVLEWYPRRIDRQYPLGEVPDAFRALA